jgi:hypothetical protein
MDKADITPQVAQNTGHGIPMLLPGSGDNAAAARKKAHAIFAETFVRRRLGYELGASFVIVTRSNS